MTSKRINHYCPECDSEDLERCFGVSPELFGYSDHCMSCGWRGHSPYWVDYTVPSRNWMPEREPFTDWPNGQGVHE